MTDKKLGFSRVKEKKFNLCKFNLCVKKRKGQNLLFHTRTSEEFCLSTSIVNWFEMLHKHEIKLCVIIWILFPNG